MALYVFLSFIGAACVATLANWRFGLPLLIVAGLAEDPVRKLTSGAPAYLTLSSVPIYICAVVGVLSREKNVVTSMTAVNPQLKVAMRAFLFSLVPASVIATAYGPGSWQVALIGLFSYVSAMLSVVLGFQYSLDTSMLRKLLAFYCIATACMLVGTPLEYMGYRDPWRLLGTAALNTKWIRQESGGIDVWLIAGLFRSPDIMAWHAAHMAMIAVCMGMSRPGSTTSVWFALAAWGGVCVTISGRRKAFWMLPLFMLMYFLLVMIRQRARGRTMILMIVAALCIMGAGYMGYGKLGRNENVEEYYFGSLTRTAEQFIGHAFSSVAETYRQSGFFGIGIGMATSGRHRVVAAKARAWQEEGLARLLVELGLLGFLCAIWVGLELLRACRRIFLQIGRAESEIMLVAGLISCLCAHAFSFVVSHQVYATPFVGLFLPITVGFILSAKRLVRRRFETSMRHLAPNERQELNRQAGAPVRDTAQ